MPYFAEVKRLIKEGKIGKPLHVTYDYFLNSNHGGDYFKRWHRKMENSEGMLLHKSTHHFDIVNWLLEDEPAKVTALGNRVYFGDESKSHAKRCKECTYTECECYSSQTGPCDEEMYYKAEHEDGYIRDKCSFLPDADIYDNMSVSVQYQKGAILAYSLHLFSTYEGYRMTVTGEKGVLETAIGYSEEEVNDPKFTVKITYRNGQTEVVRCDKASGGHGGGDDRLIAMLFGGEKDDPLGQCADGFAGFTSAMIGIGANESIKEGKTVNLTERLDKLR
jgi:predicted dehydrogenase